MKINTIKSDDPFGTKHKFAKAKPADETPLVFSTDEKKTVKDISEKPEKTEKPKEKPKTKRPGKNTDPGKSACKNWEATLIIEFAKDAGYVLDPGLAGIILYSGDEKYPAEFVRYNIAPAKDPYTVKFHIHGLKGKPGGRAIASKSAMWVARADGIAIIGKNWAAKPVRLVDFSISTRKSSADALPALLRCVRFMRIRETDNVAKTGNSM